MTYKNLGNTGDYWQTAIDSPVGVLGLVATRQGLRAVLWRDETNPRETAQQHSGGC